MLDACENYESCSEAQNNDLVLCTNPNLVPRFLPKNTITRTRSRVVAMLPVASCDRNKEKLYKKFVSLYTDADFTFSPCFIF